MYLQEGLVYAKSTRPTRQERRAPLPSNFEQDSLHSVITLPLSKAGQLDRVDLTKIMLNAYSSNLQPSQRTFPSRWSTHGRLTREIN